MAAAFGGDEAAFRRVNPLDQLHATGFPASAGIVVVGRDDPVYRTQAQLVTTAARAAGMSIQLTELPGGHSWTMAAEALTGALPWLSARTGLLPPP